MHALYGVAMAEVPPQQSGHMNPIVLGTVCGLLHAIGPDHLATLVTFSALMDPWAAAKVGAAWGAGHCVGIIAVAFVVLCAARVPGIHVDNWEHYGDYAIGLSMIFVSLYFIFRENRYIETMADGRVDVKGCACHPNRTVEKLSNGVTRRKKAGFCSDFHHASESSRRCPDSPCESDLENTSEASPLIAESQPKQASTQGKDLQGALVGLLQGMCCPMGLVGMGFAAGRTPIEITVMAITTVVVSISGTAGVAAGWAYITSSSWMGNVNPKFVYRMSCLLGLILGILWIAANYLDVLDKLNYAEGQVTLGTSSSKIRP